MQWHFEIERLNSGFQKHIPHGVNPFFRSGETEVLDSVQALER